ncbi:hypothetical protein PR003_g26461 [Phytophthora rubi]|uniref:SET domain-containing protein n=1 Tax=Phytophthora rubi TaxID=129364 RepID=A0A6A4CAB3_9STRA|nr:hypothetical protein PR003_g26461 [Phytophthora rubi]
MPRKIAGNGGHDSESDLEDTAPAPPAKWPWKAVSSAKSKPAKVVAATNHPSPPTRSDLLKFMASFSPGAARDESTAPESSFTSVKTSSLPGSREDSTGTLTILSGEDENTPPNVASGSAASRDDNSCGGSVKIHDNAASTGTATPPWLPPGTSKLGLPKCVTNPPTSSPEAAHCSRSPTTSSPVLLDTPPRSALRPVSVTTSLRTCRERRQASRDAAAPYAPTEQVECRGGNLPERSSTAPEAGDVRRTSLPSAPVDVLALARWPCRVAHLREQYNPLGFVFPAVAHFGWCACTSPCRPKTYRNALMNVYCNVNCCPYRGVCGNGLAESTKPCMMRNERNASLCVVTAEDIDAGEVLGQYLGAIDLVRPSVRDRLRNRGCRLILKTHPESSAYPVRVVVNTKFMGGMMRFVNHACNPVVEFREVSNGRRTTVVVATTVFIREGREISVDYGDDLWSVCRCGYKRCHHQDTQNE